MRFKIGFALGFAAGYWVGMTPTDQRKAKLDEALTNVRENPRLQRVTDTVVKDAKRLGDAVEHRIVGKADELAGNVASTVEPDEGASSAGTSTSAPPKHSKTA
ncbi:MAG: hypothetical protein JXA83_08840 [Acidimicrobiales bacterium]|nr:hypothetical protein [Acidimicrobiales bacterium]